MTHIHAPATTVLTDLEAMMGRVSDPLTVIKGSIGTVLMHWEELADDERRDLLGHASAGVDRVIRALGNGHISPPRPNGNRAEPEPGVSVLVELDGQLS